MRADSDTCIDRMVHTQQPHDHGLRMDPLVRALSHVAKAPGREHARVLVWLIWYLVSFTFE